MVTIVTHIPLKDGADRQWDTVMHERMASAKGQPGWVGGQVLRSPNGRVVVGTWQSQADWAAWHRTAAFAETRRKLTGLADGPTEPGWHEVVFDVRKEKGARSARAAGRHPKAQAIATKETP
jgi:heme-degrading monooxygenase HmoA